MISTRWCLAPARRYAARLPRLSLLLAAISLAGCTQHDAPAPARSPGVTQPSAAAADLASAGASAAPAAISAPGPEKERPWDSCSPQDPNPWPWRSDAEGMWGEKNAAAVPAFALRQERRAPKMPDAERYLKTLGHTTEARALQDALLICQVETYSRNGLQPTLYQYKLRDPPARTKCMADWDTLNGPDVLLRFRFRNDYPLALFGPEDHWGFFVSIPGVALAAGDTLSVKLWDRDAGTYWNGYVNDQRNEYMGAATMKYDGTLPFTLHSEFFTVRCNAMGAPQTRALAKSWLDQLDRPIKAASDWRPDTNRWDLGASDTADSIRGDFGHGIFRYPAGFLGWESPEIQARLQTVHKIGAADASKRRALVTELVHSSPPIPTDVYTLDGGRGPIRFESAECRSGDCEVRAQVGPRALKDLCTQSSPRPLLRASGIDESGKFAGAFPEIEQAGTWQSCYGDPAAAKDGMTAVRIKLLGAPQLLWLGGVGKAAIFKLPPQTP